MSSVTVVVPMTVRRRGGRKQIIGPDGAPIQARQDGPDVETTRGDPALVKALARAFRWRRMLEEGRYASMRELAAAEKMERSFVARALTLTLLAPDIIDAVLDGREPPALAQGTFRQGFPHAWDAQRTTFGGASSGHKVRPGLPADR